MEIIRDLETLTRHPYPVTAIGNFDGVHLGHRAILKAAIDRARAAAGTAFALTFDPLPAQLLVPDRAPRPAVDTHPRRQARAAEALGNRRRDRSQIHPRTEYALAARIRARLS